MEKNYWFSDKIRGRSKVGIERDLRKCQVQYLSGLNQELFQRTKLFA